MGSRWAGQILRSVYRWAFVVVREVLVLRGGNGQFVSIVVNTSLSHASSVVAQHSMQDREERHKVHWGCRPDGLSVLCCGLERSSAVVSLWDQLCS